MYREEERYLEKNSFHCDFLQLMKPEISVNSV
jgi:hypothetical protein